MDIKYDTECGLVEVPGVLDKKPDVNVIDVDLIPDLGNVNISHLFLLHYRWLPYSLISYMSLQTFTLPCTGSCTLPEMLRVGSNFSHKCL